MGHAVHFLQRIERLSPAQADLALTLYREPALIAHVLRRVQLPDGAERVALALEDGPDAPHVILTRDGRFVTCLGAGMTVGECPVVPRAQIDRASEWISLLNTAVAQRGETARLWRLVLESGGALSREDFLALAALVPILGNEYVAAAIDMSKFQIAMLQRYRRARYRKITPKIREDLHLYWTAEWAVGHLAALCGERPDDLRALCVRGKQGFEVLMNALVEMSMYTMSTPVVLRGAWAAARGGRVLLPKLRQKLQAAQNRVEAMHTGLPLAATALRHRGTYAEVTKALASQRRKLQDADPHASNGGQVDILLREIQKIMDTAWHERLRRDHIALGAHAYAAFAERFPADSPMRITRVEDVPDDLALTAAVNFEGDLYADRHDIARTLTAVPWLATASGADLYLPATFFEACGPMFNLEATLKRMDSYYHYFLFDRPVRAVARPGRNEPCSCGSGQKYKRCCGAAA
jgi:hypothetical protein